MTCRACAALLGDYLDDALPSPLQRTLSVHLVHCPPCRRHALTYAGTVDLARHAFDAPPPLPEAVTRAILTAIAAIPA